MADRLGLGVVAEHDGHQVGGHGIGRQMHEDPMVLSARPGEQRAAVSDLSLTLAG